MLPKCPKCGVELQPVYPLDLKTLWVDFFVCPKCNVAYEPKNLKPIANII
jgi:Zn-finger nucleic acid-binding protein